MKDRRNLGVYLTPLDAKAVEDYRSPRRFAPTGTAGRSAKSFTVRVAIDSQVKM